jgi:hypothetical protein
MKVTKQDNWSKNSRLLSLPFWNRPCPSALYGAKSHKGETAKPISPNASDCPCYKSTRDPSSRDVVANFEPTSDR